MKGLDISSYQKGINFDIIKNAGIEFLILRAGFTGWGTGVNYNKDDYFEEFYNNSKKLGIPVGAYWYSCANTYDKGVAEAKYMYENCLKGKRFEYPIYIDVEDEHHQVSNKKGVTDAIIGFCEYLENLGYYVGIYASDISGFKEKMYIEKLEDYDKWVARYNDKPQYVKNYGMWQSSSKGEINGYSGYLDINESYKDYETIIKKAGLNGFEKQEKNVNSLDNYNIDELVHKVINGDYGNGEERKAKLGPLYNEVQNKVNEYYINESKRKLYIDRLSHKVINGDYGNGEERKAKLGLLYDEVQNRVNEILKK